MVKGWQDQQLARGLNKATIAPRLRMIARFQTYTNDYPWAWTAPDVEEFTFEPHPGPSDHNEHASRLSICDRAVLRLYLRSALRSGGLLQTAVLVTPGAQLLRLEHLCTYRG